MSDKADDALMNRFLLGEVTPEEQEQVERRFMDDPAFFEELCALEDELLLAHTRGELSDAQRRIIDARAAASPARTRRLEDMKALATAVSAARTRRNAAPAAPAAKSTRSIRSMVWLASAAMLVVTLAGTWVWSRRTTTSPDAASVDRQPSHRAPIAFFLSADNPRGVPAPQQNVFRIPALSATIVLTLTIPGQAPSNVGADLALVRGASLAGTFDVRTQPRPEATDVSVTVPATLLAPGDYLLTVTGEIRRGSRDTIARRFFSIVP